MDDMEFAQEGINFYHMKIASYMNYPKGGPLDRCDWEPRPAEGSKYQEKGDREKVKTKDPQTGEKRSRDESSSGPALKRPKTGEGKYSDEN
jgi:hypothetical protein